MDTCEKLWEEFYGLYDEFTKGHDMLYRYRDNQDGYSIEISCYKGRQCIGKIIHVKADTKAQCLQKAIRDMRFLKGYKNYFRKLYAGEVQE